MSDSKKKIKIKKVQQEAFTGEEKLSYKECSISWKDSESLGSASGAVLLMTAAIGGPTC